MFLFFKFSYKAVYHSCLTMHLVININNKDFNQ